MRPSRSANITLLHMHYSWQIFTIDLALVLVFFFIPNMAIGYNLIYSHNVPEMYPHARTNFRHFHDIVGMLPDQSIAVWATANTVVTCLLFVLRRHVLSPIYGMAYYVRNMLSTLQPVSLTQDAPAHSHRMSLKTIARDMAHMTHVAHSYYLKHHEAKLAQTQAEEALAHIHQYHEALISCTSREIN